VASINQSAQRNVIGGSGSAHGLGYPAAYQSALGDSCRWRRKAKHAAAINGLGVAAASKRNSSAYRRLSLA